MFIQQMPNKSISEFYMLQNNESKSLYLLCRSVHFVKVNTAMKVY